MTGAEFKARLRLLHRTQTGFAAELGVATRTVHYWADRGPPSEVGYLLDLLISLEQPFGPSASATESFISSLEFKGKVINIINRLGDEADHLGRRKDFESAITAWIENNT